MACVEAVRDRRTARVSSGSCHDPARRSLSIRPPPARPVPRIPLSATVHLAERQQRGSAVPRPEMVTVHSENAVLSGAPFGRPAEPRGRHEHRRDRPRSAPWPQQVTHLAARDRRGRRVALALNHHQPVATGGPARGLFGPYVRATRRCHQCLREPAPRRGRARPWTRTPTTRTVAAPPPNPPRPDGRPPSRDRTSSTN